MGVNASGCGYGSRCGCWEWDGVALDPPDLYPLDLRNAGCPNESPSSNIQQIQYGYGATNSYGHSYEVLLKTINRTGAMCVAARIFGGSWVVGTLSIIQAVDPFIMKADFTGLIEDNPVFLFYGMEFPTNAVADCQSGYGAEGYGALPVAGGIPPAPERASGATPDQLDMLRRIKLRMASPCQHLGEALETVPSCGCGGTLAIKHGCSVHGQCRISSRDKALPNCIDCDSYVQRVL
jgi:hypothetical protein